MQFSSLPLTNGHVLYALSKLLAFVTAYRHKKRNISQIALLPYMLCFPTDYELLATNREEKERAWRMEEEG